MNRVTRIICFLVIFKRLSPTSCLVELLPFGDTVIVTTEAIIRDTFNKVLNILNTLPEIILKLKRNFSIPKYFVNVTLQEAENVKDIFKETRLSRIKDDEENYVDIINEVLNDDIANASEPVQDEQTLQVLESLMSELEHLKSPLNLDQDFENKVYELINRENKESQIFVKDNHSLEESFQNHTSPYWTPDDDIELASGRRIYHGKATKIKHFPFVAAVLLFQMFYCAGSIISSDLVITAASCLQLAWNNRLFRENPAFISVRVGSSFHAGGGEVVPVQELYFHPSYDPRTLQSNLCMLRLRKHLKFTGKRKRKIKKIMYDTNEHSLPVNTPGITIVGWGAKEASNIIKYGDPLRHAILDIYSLRDCQDVYSKKYVRRQHFCAGFISKGGGACNHDVGDPGIVDGTLVGVVTFGAPVCGTPDAPTVFTKVGFYSNWIEEIMEMDVPTVEVRTTTKAPRTIPTLPTVTTTTVMPYPKPLADKLRSYFEGDKNLYNTFLKTLEGKDINQLIAALRGVNSFKSQTNTMVSETTLTSSQTEIAISPAQSDSNEGFGYTQGVVFVDSFETGKDIIQEKKPKIRHKYKKHNLRKKIVTNTDKYEEMQLKPMQSNNYMQFSSEEVALSTIKESLSKKTSTKYSLPRKSSANAKYFLTSTTEFENRLIEQHYKQFGNQDTTTTGTGLLDYFSIRNEITPFQATTFSYVPHSVNITSMEETKKNKEKSKYGDQVQAAEEFFTHSILEYFAHRQVNSEGKIKLKKNNLGRVNRGVFLTEYDTRANATKESYDELTNRNSTENGDDEKYIKYLKSMSPEEFYKVLSLAVNEFEKEIKHE